MIRYILFFLLMFPFFFSLFNTNGTKSITVKIIIIYNIKTQKKKTKNDIYYDFDKDDRVCVYICVCVRDGKENNTQQTADGRRQQWRQLMSGASGTESAVESWRDNINYGEYKNDNSR